MIVKKYQIFEKTIILRYPRLSDSKDLMNLINSLVKERSDIAKITQVTLRKEREWLSESLQSIRKKCKILILAELEGKIVGSCEISRDKYEVSQHVGTLGIAITREARGIGIGTTLINEAMKEANKIGIKLVKLYVFDSNKRARELYERIGFVAAGVVPKGVYHNKKYKDDVMMIKRS